MAIEIGREGRLFTLHTEKSSYQMFADEKGVLLHLYYGARIEENDELMDLLFLTDMGFSGNPVEAGRDRAYSLDTLPQEVSGFGVGDYRDSMIALVQPNGSRAASFRFCGYDVRQGAYEVTGMPALYDTSKEQSQTLVITMREVASDVMLELYYGVFEQQNVITRAAKIINQGNACMIAERALSMNLDMMFQKADMIYFAGRHVFERRLERVPIRHAKTEIGSVRGTSSHHYNPSMIVCDTTATEDAGNCYGFCLVYSGNFVGGVQMDQKDTIRVQMGIHPQGFCYHIEPGESFMTPQVIMSFSAEGLTLLSQQYHDVLREHMCRGRYKHEKRPVLINNWEATYFDFDEKKLLELASQAAELGIEMLVLDDGWFGKRNDDYSGLGDWFVNEQKLGGGLRSLGEKINALGMKFGLWFEPEMISEDSNLYREHPDWAFHIPYREPNRSRYQLVLDMSRSDVRNYLLERMTDIIENAPIAYVKWDMNRSICDVYSHVNDNANNGELYHRYMLGVYDLLEQFHRRFPDILLEGCSGGGGRFDAGMLYYAPQIWCSDNTDAINRLEIQYGSSFFYPISSFGSHVSACPNHQTGRSVPFATRGDVALSGSFGYELDLGQITEEERQQIKGQLQQFHTYYELTHEGDYFRLSTPGEEWMAWEFVSKDKSQAMVTLVKTECEGNALPIHIRIKGLNKKQKYQCSLGGATKSGAAWMQAGITIPHQMKQYESIVIEWKRL